jgi:hypothetical protein
MLTGYSNDKMGSLGGPPGLPLSQECEQLHFFFQSASCDSTNGGWGMRSSALVGLRAKRR